MLGIAFYASLFYDNRFSPYKSYVLAGMVPVGVFAMSTSLFYYKVQWMLAALAAVRIAEYCHMARRSHED